MNPESTTCIRCTDQAGSNNHHWKGGKYIIKAGYVQIRVSEHPRVLTQKDTYVFEHILVMEEHLGRYLLPGENVHHKNGVKDDNTIDNLELWCKPQPSGVRAKDALSWARQILDRYESVENLL